MLKKWLEKEKNVDPVIMNLNTLKQLKFKGYHVGILDVRWAVNKVPHAT